jgi:hypothetical protein
MTIPRALVFLAALLAASCGGGRPAVYPVRGRVLDAQGGPAAGALVVFHPRHGGGDVKPLARAGADGVFVLTTFKEGDGAPAGEYAVTVEWPAAKKGPLDPEGPDRLRGRYRDPASPAARFTVEKRPDNEVPPLRLR